MTLKASAKRAQAIIVSSKFEYEDALEFGISKDKIRIIPMGVKVDKTIKEKATFDDPHQYSSGIQYVIVNGVLVIDHGKHLGSRPGEILFGKGRVN